MSETVERWTYTGRRQGATSTVQAFETPAGERYFVGIAPAWARPGARFDVTVDDRSVYTKGAKAPRFVDRVDDERIPAWTVLDVAEENRALAIRKGKLAAGLGAFDELTIAELRGLYVVQRTKTARAALVAKLLEAIVG